MIVRQSDLERLLLAAEASSKGTVIFSFPDRSLSLQTSVTFEMSSWRTDYNEERSAAGIFT